MQPSSERASSGSSRQMRRWGPVAALVVIVAVVVVVVVAGSGSTKKGVSSGPPTTVGTTGGPGAISFAQAKAAHLSVTFPPGCDRQRGTVAIPYYFAPPCYANVANNGGATAQGVTATSVKVVLYLPQPDDPILKFIEAAVQSNDTNAQGLATYQGYIRMFEAYYQTYGRKVDLQVVHASGTAIDEVAARADAAKAAALKPFAVWGGPVLTTAWADELAADHIICLSCMGGNTPDWYAKRAPYVITVTPSAEQASQTVAEYVGKKLAGHLAAHAGDPALASQTRKFGLLYIEANADSKTLADAFVAQLKAQYNVDVVSKLAYTLDPSRLQEEADSTIAKLKSAGVTTVIFSGDPVAPATFTRQATTQGWFPEWVIGASALVDTTAFGRGYDQRQWAHAFGVSFLTARLPAEDAGSYYLYKWFTGQPPPAATTNGLLLPQPATFYAALQAAGPDLSPDTFRDGLFTIAPRANPITDVTISYGNHGLWPYTDYNGIDDATEVWWDPNATGPDEIRKQGTGMYRYVDGGRRYLPGQWPTGDTRAFDVAGSVTIYAQAPPNDAVPAYPSPAGG
jgi:hypothetical protein